MTEQRKRTMVKTKVVNVTNTAVEPLAGVPISGVKAANTDIPNDTVAITVGYNAWHLFGCEVLKPLLQNSLELVFEDCFVGKFAVGNFEGFWKACLGAGNKCLAIAKELDGNDKRRVTAVGKALLNLYINGLSDDSMLLVYTACKGQLMPSMQLEDSFMAEVKAKRLALADVETGVPIAELRYRFETGIFAEHCAKIEASKASGRAWYESQAK